MKSQNNIPNSQPGTTLTPGDALMILKDIFVYHNATHGPGDALAVLWVRPRKL
jgi:hypothetical protein